MWIYDAETLRFLAVHAAAVERYGFTREQFLDMTVADIDPSDVPAPGVTPAPGSSRPRPSGAQPWRHRTRGGSVIDAEVRSHGLTFAGRPARLVIAQDVTERRRLEEQLRQAQKMEAVGRL